jgi:hypothetical protein
MSAAPKVYTEEYFVLANQKAGELDIEFSKKSYELERIHILLNKYVKARNEAEQSASQDVELLKEKVYKYIIMHRKCFKEWFDLNEERHKLRYTYDNSLHSYITQLKQKAEEDISMV